MSWTEEVTGISEDRIYSMTVFNGELYVGTGNNAEVWKRTSGGVWTQEVIGISDVDIFSMAVFGDELYVGTYPEGEVWKLGPQATITLNYSRRTLPPYNTLQLIATTVPVDAEVTWTSSNIGRATVSSTGLVTSIREGEVIITATITGASATCNVSLILDPRSDYKYGVIYKLIDN